jgi:hypothetical protein
MMGDNRHNSKTVAIGDLFLKITLWESPFCLVSEGINDGIKNLNKIRWDRVLQRLAATDSHNPI